MVFVFLSIPTGPYPVVTIDIGTSLIQYKLRRNDVRLQDQIGLFTQATNGLKASETPKRNAKLNRAILEAKLLNAWKKTDIVRLIVSS
jgi:hypothetical protein